LYHGTADAIRKPGVVAQREDSHLEIVVRKPVILANAAELTPRDFLWALSALGILRAISHAGSLRMACTISKPSCSRVLRKRFAASNIPLFNRASSDKFVASGNSRTKDGVEILAMNNY
jgi:hypothetical protein